MDLDNTLIDRRTALAEWTAEFCAERGLSESAEWQVSEALRSRAHPETFIALREALTLVETPAELWGAYVTALAARVTCPPEMLARLDQLRADGWTVGVLTNGATDIQHAKLVSTGILGRVDAICVSEEIGIRKPDPEVFRVAAARCGHDLSSETWMVGDNPATDIAGAAAAGLRSVWISRGHEWTDPRFAPDHIAMNAIAAADLLLGI